MSNPCYPWKGRIVTEHSIECGVASCRHVEYTQSPRSKIAGRLGSLGWKLTRKYGWVCPVCAVDFPTSKGADR
jgi:hypothetical protein